MILPVDYQNIICLIDSSITDNLQANNTLLAARTMLTNMNLLTSQSAPLSIPMDSQLYNLSLLAFPNAQLTAFISKLQKHVDINYGLTRFLADNSITIPQQVAVLSSLLGFTIPAENIAPCG